MMEPTQEQLLTLYKIAVDQNRAEVAQNWDRQKFFLTLNVAVAAGAAAFRAEPRLMSCALVLDFGLAVLGYLSITAGHTYCQKTRDAFQRIEARMELPAVFAIRTTPGMRKEPRSGLERLNKITTLTKLALFLLGASELFAAVLFR